MLEAKLEALDEILRGLPGALVAYSGGADSAFLTEAAHRILPGRVLAVTADSPSLPRRELGAAKALAAGRRWTHRIVRTAELDDERYAANPVDRCYFCKTALFDVLEPLSREVGWPQLLGTNTDDLSDWRPGQQAASERGARHPLVEAGLSKNEVREASRLWGMPTADKPAAACLASRFAYGVRVTADALGRVEAAEDVLLGKGFRVVRVRDLGSNRARVEVGHEEVGRLMVEADSTRSELRVLGFEEVILDERGYRSGALNESVVLEIGRR